MFLREKNTEKPWQNMLLWDTKRLSIKKNQELPTFGELATANQHLNQHLLIFRSIRSHRCISKQVFLKISQCRSLFFYKDAGLLLQNTYGDYFFSVESGIYCRQSHRFLFQTPLKTRVKPRQEPLKLLCKTRCSQKFCKFYGKTPVLKFLFTRETWNFI